MTFHCKEGVANEIEEENSISEQIIDKNNE